jgi:CBS domain containing-hemolysin-like protein
VDDGPAVSIILFAIFIVLSGYFAGTEIALASVNRIHMISKASKGKKSAERVLWVLDNFDEALSVLLIGTNVMHIGCATIATALTLGFGAKGVTVATAVTTVLIFIFGEILPKNFARACNEKFAEIACLPLVALMKILKPVAWAFTSFSACISKPFIKSDEVQVTMTEEELNDIVENISEEDGFDEEKGELVKLALQFSNSTARDVMTPWENTEVISMALKTSQILKIVKNTTHSRIPVTDRKGNIKGILQIRKFLKAYLKNKNNVIIASIIDYPYYVSEDMPIDDVLTAMSNHRRNLSFVKNNDGEVTGILTVEDILEELVGEIYDENDIGGALDD